MKYPKDQKPDEESAFYVPYSVFFSRKSRRKAKCRSFRPATETQRMIEAKKHPKRKR